jgi:CRISPR-associated protein Cmr1
MEVIRAEYTLVTPMFIGGAMQTPSDGIRPPSVKGALRFWWRALNWGKFQKKYNETQALKMLHQEEARLFGTAISNAVYQGGQGCFLLSIQQPTTKKICNDWPPNDPNNGASYMAYGLLKTKQEPHRTALTEGVTFTLKLAFKPNTTTDDYQQIKAALEAWSLMGGLGARARRAMGSITLINLNDTPVLYDKTTYETKLKQRLTHFNTIPLAPYTALSKESDYRIIETGDTARELVERIGARYKAFRQERRGRDKIPFGLPLQDVDLDNRRSSPLFFHLHQLSDKKVAATLIYLPAAIFHPQGGYQHLSMRPVKAFLSCFSGGMH